MRERMRRSGLSHLGLGYVSRDDLVALYSCARCMLFTSAYEGLGLPLPEAMASDCPVAALPQLGDPEVAGDAALLVDDGDAAALSAAAARLLEDGGERSGIVEAGLRRVAGSPGSGQPPGRSRCTGGRVAEARGGPPAAAPWRPHLRATARGAARGGVVASRAGAAIVAAVMAADRWR